MAVLAGTASPRPDPGVQAQVERFILWECAAGRSLRELAELTVRSFSAVRNILDRHGVRRRGVGAARVTEELSRPPSSQPRLPLPFPTPAGSCGAGHVPRSLPSE